MYTDSNTEKIMQFDWMIASPYSFVQIGVWTGQNRSKLLGNDITVIWT